MKRYLIHHSRAFGTFDLIDERGQLSVERFFRGGRMRSTLADFEKSQHAITLAAQLRNALSKLEMDRQVPAARVNWTESQQSPPPQSPPPATRAAG